MQKLKVNLNYCYGIKNLEYEFDFENGKNYLLYAPNGMMKTSFTKTFAVLSHGKKPSDEAFNRPTSCSVLDENNNSIIPNDIFVINSYEDEYLSPNSAKLMVKKDLKKSYDEVIEKIKQNQQMLENSIKEYFYNDNLDVAKEITSVYGKNSNDFLEVISQTPEKDLFEQNKISLDFKEVSYTVLFDENIEKFCSDPKNIEKIEDYSKCYDELLKASPIFKRGIFSQYNAEATIANLNENRFFEAQHEVVLNGIDHPIASIQELQTIVQNERNKIFTDDKLKKKFDKIDSELNKRALSKFRGIIEAHPDIIPLLKDFNLFKRMVLGMALSSYQEQVISVISEYKKSKSIIEKIKEDAKNTRSQWDNVLDIFKSRFTVPFNIEVPNMENVVLNNELPEFIFEYRDLETDEKVPIARKNLEKILSQGEKRALYLLNIINDLEAIKNQNRSVLIITDDIAESFDYKNKYAILEYVQDLASDPNLNFIILTHNFDFFRTCSARMREMINPRMVSREKGKLKIENPRYVFRNPFSEIKRGIYQNNDNDLITAIPFIRNLVEFTSSTEDENYKRLTSLLHIKNDTYNITIKELEEIFERAVTFDQKLNFSQGRENEKVYDLIIKTAKNIVKKGETSIDLDGKIILSMAIRLLAEKFMIGEIIAVDKSGNILEEIYKHNNQTGKLLGKYKEMCSDQADNILLMNKVSLLSSENIHINSFMFEPIIDMSIKSLVDLFGRVSILV
ncbi:MAG: hypothetical protein IJS88_00960 [Alphaproteobacteria bacterium]|nr:hypothetical protein [Alphaproteobacteria bacterium]